MQKGGVEAVLCGCLVRAHQNSMKLTSALSHRCHASLFPLLLYTKPAFSPPPLPDISASLSSGVIFTQKMDNPQTLSICYNSVCSIFCARCPYFGLHHSRRWWGGNMVFRQHKILYVNVMNEKVNVHTRRDFQMMVKMMVETCPPFDRVAVQYRVLFSLIF